VRLLGVGQCGSRKTRIQRVLTRDAEDTDMLGDYFISEVAVWRLTMCRTVGWVLRRV
jgi:hypothetical protein